MAQCVERNETLCTMFLSDLAPAWHKVAVATDPERSEGVREGLAWYCPPARRDMAGNPHQARPFFVCCWLVLPCASRQNRGGGSDIQVNKMNLDI